MVFKNKLRFKAAIVGIISFSKYCSRMKLPKEITLFMCVRDGDAIALLHFGHFLPYSFLSQLHPFEESGSSCKTSWADIFTLPHSHRLVVLNALKAFELYFKCIKYNRKLGYSEKKEQWKSDAQEKKKW